MRAPSPSWQTSASVLLAGLLGLPSQVSAACAPGFTSCGTDCFDPALGEYHCVTAPSGEPLLVQGPGFNPADADAEVLPPGEQTLTTPGNEGKSFRTITMINQCTTKVWPAIQGKFGDPVPADGGFGMSPGQTVHLQVPVAWESGRIWPRTGCKINNGKVFCETGTCGIKENGYGVKCKGNGGVPPYTIVEFTLHGYKNLDYYDLSQVDGHNIGISVQALNGRKIGDPKWVEPTFDCGSASCRMDITTLCPPELSFKSSDGKRTVACGSLHNAVEDLVQRTLHPDPLKALFDDSAKRSLVGCTCDPPSHCYSKLDKRPEAEGKRCYVEEWPTIQAPGPWPKQYERVFKDRCALAYSWQFDDMSSTFNCFDADYKIQFCPAAECGTEAGGKTCPNGACCSNAGTCGTSAAECGDGCQSGCNSLEDFPGPGKCDTPPVSKVIGYYSNTGPFRGPQCAGQLPPTRPRDLRISGLTHLVYQYGVVTAGFQLGTSRSEDDDLIKEMNGLKGAGVKTLWAIGGWDFNTPGSGTESRFSSMAASSGNRATFIKDILKNIPARGFDGIELDWQFPGGARGGSDADGANFVTFLQELRKAADSSAVPMIIAVSVPPPQMNLGNFDLGGIYKVADWVTVRVYEYSGFAPGLTDKTDANRLPPISWGPESGGLTPLPSKVEIDNGLRAALKAGIPREKLVMGISFGGRTYSNPNPSCVDPKCTATYVGKPGACSNTAGFISYGEAEAAPGRQIVQNPSALVDMSVVAASNDQWMTYENPTTVRNKLQIANNQCLVGVSVSTLDMDPSGVLLMAVLGNANGNLPSSGACPQDGGRWPTTMAGSIHSYKCPYSEGEIHRQCGSDGKWGDIVNDCDGTTSQYFKDDFLTCANGPDVSSTFASLNIADVPGGGGGSSFAPAAAILRRQRQGLNGTHQLQTNFTTPARPASQPLKNNPAAVAKPAVVKAAAAPSATVQDLWDLMRTNPAGQDLPYAAGIFNGTSGRATPPPVSSTTSAAPSGPTIPPSQGGTCASTNCGVFDATSYVCCDGQLCPNVAPRRCDKACFNPSNNSCCNNQLGPPGATCAGPTTAAPPPPTPTTATAPPAQTGLPPKEGGLCQSTNCGVYDGM
ncbi:hypothetical protein HDU89_008139 [Geranomyces variabilis]|nr:hypothetical protein HDU89_008139 [Geranomyces variabilis]